MFSILVINLAWLRHSISLEKIKQIQLYQIMGRNTTLSMKLNLKLTEVMVDHLISGQKVQMHRHAKSVCQTKEHPNINYLLQLEVKLVKLTTQIFKIDHIRNV